MSATVESAKHIRLVHFSLIVACTTLLLASELSKNARIGRARRQLRDVRLIASEFRSGWFEEYLTRLHLQLKAAPQQPLLQLDGTGFHTTYIDQRDNPAAIGNGGVVTVNPIGSIRVPSNWSARWRELPREHLDPVFEDTDFSKASQRGRLTLRATRDIWNVLCDFRTVYHVRSITGIAVNSGPGYPPRCADSQAAKLKKVKFSNFTEMGELPYIDDAGRHPEFRKVTSLPEPTMRRLPYFIDDGNITDSRISPECGAFNALVNSPLTIWLQAFYDDTPSSAASRACLLGVTADAEHVKSPLADLASLAGVAPPIMSFDEAFPDLHVVTEKLDNMPLAQADAVLSVLEDQLGSDLEIFTVKIPATAIRVWGVILLLCVQFYLLLHLTEFVSLGPPSSRDDFIEPAWLGLYKSRLARAVALISAAALPAVTTVLITFQSESGSWDFRTIPAYALSSMSFLISLFTVRVMLSLPRVPQRV
jgi:hypothetical protein